MKMLFLKFAVFSIVIVTVNGLRTCGKENQRLTKKLSNFCTDICKNNRFRWHAPPKIVAFTAFLTNTITYNTDEAVKYNKVITNIGSAYKRSTGVFTAPVTGLYSFSVSLMGHSSYPVPLKFMVNGKLLMNLWTAGGGHSDLSAQTVYIKLKRGNRVWTAPRRPAKLYGQSRDIYNQFSGILFQRL